MSHDDLDMLEASKLDIIIRQNREILEALKGKKVKDPYLNTSDIMLTLDCGRSKFNSLRQELMGWGMIRVGREWRIRESRLEDFLESKRV
jgi:uncharacterized protein (UPF0548 family)